MSTSSGNRDRALKLLGSGLNNEVVATTMGVDPSYISQLMGEELFKDEVIRLRTLSLTANSERDHRADALEDQILDKIEETLPYVVRPADVLRYYAVLNNAKRRGVTAQAQTIVNNTVVNLQLPAHVLQQFTQNALGNVVEVNDRPMITMPAKQLLSNLSKNRISSTKEGSIYNDINKRIPVFENEHNSS